MLVRKMFCGLASRWSEKTRNKSTVSTGCRGKKYQECSLQQRSHPFPVSLLCVPKLLGTAKNTPSAEDLGVCIV